MLWAIIEGVPSPSGAVPFDLERFHAVESVLWISDDEEAGLVRVSDGFARALAALPDERVATVAAVWANAEEWIGPWQPGELDPTVVGLRDLARLVSDDQHMYVWVCM